jgi:integron integrase
MRAFEGTTHASRNAGISLPQPFPVHPRNLAPSPPPQQPKLLDRLAEALRARHYSPRTEQCYRHWVKRFIFFHNVRHPADMAEPEINAFLTHLAVQEKVSASTQNQALSAVLFLYRHVLDRQIGDLGEVVRARRPTRLPVVLTRAEVKAVLGHLIGDKWLMASLMYGAGLRLMECLRLRIHDVDLPASQIVVRDGKGFKDRVTMLPEVVKPSLQSHLVQVKTIHDRDLAAGYGWVQLPDALARKYPSAPKEWGW